MDTSKEYIEMCDCPEIQGTIHDWRDRKSWSYLKVKRGRLEGRDDVVWLPRQDQIQEMLPKNNCKCSCCLIFHLNKFVEDNIDGLADAKIDSMEQYWLAYYMWECHKKTWNGEKWIRQSK